MGWIIGGPLLLGAVVDGSGSGIVHVEDDAGDDVSVLVVVLGEGNSVSRPGSVAALVVVSTGIEAPAGDDVLVLGADGSAGSAVREGAGGPTAGASGVVGTIGGPLTTVTDTSLDAGGTMTVAATTGTSGTSDDSSGDDVLGKEDSVGAGCVGSGSAVDVPGLVLVL